ncbi:MAG: recombination-associated protein RdgC [Alcaligenaceae bacterium]|nr:recombination-associated protein RdgC [Alcaligenaceae bacterium]
MWFKNLKVYRLSNTAGLSPIELEAALEKMAFQPGSSQDSQASGWMAPREDGRLAYTLNGQILLRLHTEKKLLPTTVINQASRARAQDIEGQQGYRPGRKQMKEIKEQITMELLPRAFVIAHDTHVWIDTANRWLVIDAAATAKADEVMSLLSKTITPFPAIPLHVEVSPAAAMTQWLYESEAPAGFDIDQDTELRATGESRATIRYVRQSVDIEDVRKHVKAGKQCTRLALTWAERVSFILTENLDIKRVAPLDVLQETQNTQAANEDEQFDADLTLMTGELARLLADLVDALGGEPAAASGS